MKNYVVIGGSSGIGQALAQILCDAGHQVFATYHTTAVVSASSSIHYSSLNVLDDEPNFDFLPSQIDGIAYCPGRINLKPFSRMKPSEFEEDYRLQVLGAIKVLQAAFPKLRKSKKGSVVLFSTVAVQTGFNFHSQVAASKGAIEGLTKALAAEWAPSVRVNAIAPSLTDTPLAAKLLSSEEKKEANAQRHPLKKIGQASDIAETAVFLLSEKSSWITGQILHVDGGMSSIV